MVLSVAGGRKLRPCLKYLHLHYHSKDTKYYNPLNILCHS